jgi:hypothetical protein
MENLNWKDKARALILLGCTIFQEASQARAQRPQALAVALVSNKAIWEVRSQQLWEPHRDSPG